MKKIFMILCICAAMTAGSGHVLAQGDVSGEKLEEILRDIDALKTQQEQILENQRKILESIDAVSKTVNRIRGM